jgi:DNA-binding MarR family transcriptional regulator
MKKDPADEALKLDNQLCFPLYAAARKITNAYVPYLKPLGLTYTQYLVFLVLWEKDSQTVGDICSRLYLDNGTLSPLLKKLEIKGLISKIRTEKDERIVTVSLTEKGKKLKEKVKDVPFAIGRCFPLESKDAIELHRLLHDFLIS